MIILAPFPGPYKDTCTSPGVQQVTYTTQTHVHVVYQNTVHELWWKGYAIIVGGNYVNLGKLS